MPNCWHIESKLFANYWQIVYYDFRYLLIMVWEICWLRFEFVDYNFFSAQVPLQEFLSVILKNVLASQRIILWVLPSSTLQEEFLQLVANLYLLSLESVSQLGEFHSDVVMVWYYIYFILKIFHPWGLCCSSSGALFFKP